MNRQKHYIDISTYTKSYVGQKTLNDIEKRLKDLQEVGETGAIVDIKDYALRNDFNEAIARMELLYNCTFEGIGDKRIEVDIMKETGYIHKQIIGRESYIARLRELIEKADYPLMVKDNRLEENTTVALNIIQPIGFEGNRFYYNILKHRLTEPKALEKACWYTHEGIWEETYMDYYDMWDDNTRCNFRFAKDKEERTTIDLLSGIIAGKYRGFYRER